LLKTVIAIFTDQDNATHAVNTLESAGYDPKDVSIVMKDTAGAQQMKDDTGSDVAAGAVSGATTGAVVGGIAGLVASFMLPGLGSLFIGGPIATALGLTGAAATTASGVATGAVAGGIVGALTGWGLSEDEARMYEKRVSEGGILVAVPAKSGDESKVAQILHDQHADDVKTVTPNK
jgi:uncharacterized membrane protein